MLDSLKFVQGSIAKKNFIPALTHFVIENGNVRGFNGIIALSSSIPFDIACKPEAIVLIKAIGNCNETVQLSLTPTGRLSIKSGGFKAFINCIQEDTCHAMPEGDFVNFDGEAFLKALKIVTPFIGDDASRKWTNGVLIENGSLFATNNVTLIQYWLGVELTKVINIPAIAVREMLRIGEPPKHAQLSETSITFHYEAGRWLRTQLYSTTEWPNLEKILDQPTNQLLLNNDIFAGLKVLKAFVDKQGTVIFGQNVLNTHDEETEGASFQITGQCFEGRYNIEMLELLEGVAKTIDWSTYPKACLFRNDRLRGAIIGMRK